MKAFTTSTLIFLAMLFIFFPWLIGVADMAWYIITGSKVSSVEWNSGRGGVAFFWPLLWLFAAAGISL